MTSCSSRLICDSPIISREILSTTSMKNISMIDPMNPDASSLVSYLSKKSSHPSDLSIWLSLSLSRNSFDIFLILFPVKSPIENTNNAQKSGSMVPDKFVMKALIISCIYLWFNVNLLDSILYYHFALCNPILYPIRLKMIWIKNVMQNRVIQTLTANP